MNTFVQWEGWYADEWATTKAHFLLRRNGDRIRIRGSLPQVSERLRGKRLKVFCNGERLTEFPVSFGDFEHVVPLRMLAGGELLEVTIEATRFFVPCDEGIGADPRVLSYLLREVA